MASVSLNNLANIINTVKWVKTCDYQVLLNPVDLGFAKLIDWGQTDDTQKSIDISLKNITIPQFSARFEEILTAGKWHFARGADPVFQIDMTFRDFNNGTMYRRFINAFEKSGTNYSKRCYFRIEAFLNNTERNILVMGTNEALVSDVSQLNLAQDNSEILEFSVSFKCNRPVHDNSDIKNINFSNTSTSTGQESITSKANNIFSNLLKNGLNRAQDAIVGKLESMVENW